MQGIKSKAFALVCLSVFAANSYADVYNCVGNAPNGASMTVVYDDNAGTLKVNNTEYKMIGLVPNSRDVRSEEFTDPGSGTKAYASLTIISAYSIVMRQINASNNQEMMRVELSCE